MWLGGYKPRKLERRLFSDMRLGLIINVMAACCSWCMLGAILRDTYVAFGDGLDFWVRGLK